MFRTCFASCLFPMVTAKGILSKKKKLNCHAEGRRYQFRYHDWKSQLQLCLPTNLLRCWFLLTGTNDLIHTMAADCMNEQFHLWQPYNLSILRLINNVKAAHFSKAVNAFGMCGETAVPLCWNGLMSSQCQRHLFVVHALWQKKLDTAKMEEYANRVSIECATMEEVLNFQRIHRRLIPIKKWRFSLFYILNGDKIIDSFL